jgi:hypothetical protein
LQRPAFSRNAVTTARKAGVRRKKQGCSQFANVLCNISSGLCSDEVAAIFSATVAYNSNRSAGILPADLRIFRRKTPPSAGKMPALEFGHF